MVANVEQAIARVTTRPTPPIHSLAGDLACNDPSLRRSGWRVAMGTGPDVGQGMRAET
ncbi:MAG: hypothetical protein ACRDH5_14340 [bacterium]